MSPKPWQTYTTTNVVRSRLSSPWYNHRCQVAKTATRRLERRYRSTHSAEDYRSWRALSEAQRIILQEEYTSFISNTIESCTDSKSLWQRMTPCSTQRRRNQYRIQLKISVCTLRTRYRLFEQPLHRRLHRWSYLEMSRRFQASSGSRWTKCLVSSVNHRTNNVSLTQYRHG